MSRALDPKIKNLLKHGDHEPVYRCIAQVLALREEELLDIEILGPSHILSPAVYVLYEENAVAIPKLNILRAFLPAYKIFQGHLNGQHTTPEEVLQATSVILLLDPEHMTAANARKRHVRRIKAQNPDQIESALDTELYFIDSLLTSRLHRHTKSPTLWGHRQWLQEQCIARPRPMDNLSTAMEKLIFVSAERHPRNYYAWCHARYLLGRKGPAHDATDRAEHGLQAQQNTATLDILTEMVKKWCFAHPSDTSGWSFLTMLVKQRPQAAASSLFSETLRFAEAFSWRGESVWYFLRNMLRRDWVEHSHRENFERVLKLVHGKAAEPGELDRQVLSHMLEWTKLYAESGCRAAEA
ncbi:Protein prenyltransferase alpha subunit repeat-containing protein 1 [Beauveria bassiana]|nr:Protein prenyltransferase alpha subunit repeat-containing protein 1 [Beauveria bassiana]KAH8716052.1 Protein prenyltransferase alpha subunit repeat-containing protein 1 [Beauveria bassiana]